MTTITSHKSFCLDLPPSCIAYCPTRTRYFVVGTYYLHPASDSDDFGNRDEKDTVSVRAQVQRRSGSLILCRHEGETM